MLKSGTAVAVKSLWKRAKGYGRIKQSHVDVAEEERSGKTSESRKEISKDREGDLNP
jgi:hypothetical protein